MTRDDAPPGDPVIDVGLIGRHIGASRSPWLHESEGRAQGLRVRYTLFDFAVAGKDVPQLDDQLQELAAAGFAGVNVTYPYKQAVLPLLDAVSAGAERVGAVNTVVFAGGRRTGHNTDVTGFAESFREGLPGAPLGTVVQVGAGGGGAATAQALLDLGVGRLLVADTDAGRAAVLVDRLERSAGAGRAIVCGDPASALRTADGLVNATPVGMAATPGLPVDVGDLRPATWVADIVYFPLETALLRAARQRGCRTLDGGGMAVHQAAAAFDLFTGRHADRARMRRSFEAWRPDCVAPPVGL